MPSLFCSERGWWWREREAEENKDDETREKEFLGSPYVLSEDFLCYPFD